MVEFETSALKNTVDMGQEINVIALKINYLRKQMKAALRRYELLRHEESKWIDALYESNENMQPFIDKIVMGEDNTTKENG